jgi:carbohydrate-selective porin OprB
MPVGHDRTPPPATGQTLVAGRPGTGAAGTPSGLTLFGGVSWNHGKTSKVDHAAFAGLVANGLWAARSFDTQGIAVTGARFNGVGQSYETVIELHYRVQVTKWFSLQPNLQWVLRPGATGQIPSAFVVGLQTVIDF